MQTARQRITREDYLALEETSDVKHELYRGEVFAMTGGTFSHSKIAGNAFSMLRTGLRGKGCAPMTSDMRVRAPSGLDTYPDLSVYCGEPELTDNQTTLLNPVLILEVLSPSTSSFDRGDKFQMYRSISSLIDYLLVDSERVLVEHFRRTDQEEWVLRVYRGLAETVPLGSLKERLELAALYEDVELPDNPRAGSDRLVG